MNVLLIFQLILLRLALPADAATTAIELQYIETYKDIAISEMHRSGIPASITLAQGLLESQAGRSDLATIAKNHFGIKCKSTWTGPSYYKEDDDRDKHGRLKPSCFRAYDLVEQSYVDHTNFLVHRKRYESLFSYGKDDYVNWAIGLQRCGYATDKRYSNKVISIIKKHNLHVYDAVDVPTREKPTNVLMPAYRIPDNYRRGDGRR